MARETLIQSQVASYQKLKKWFLIPPCLTLSNISYISRLKWNNAGKGEAPSLHLGVVAIEKKSLLVVLDYSRQLYFTFIIVFI